METQGRQNTEGVLVVGQLPEQGALEQSTGPTNAL